MELKPLDSTDRSATERSLLKSDSTTSSSSAASSFSYSENLLELEKKYAPYVRKDVYGPMGRGEVPLTEKFLLGLAAVTLIPIRFISGILILILYFLVCRLCTLFSAPGFGSNGAGDPIKEEEDFVHMTGWRREAVVQAGRFCARAMLFVFGFYWIPVEDRSISTNEVCSTVLLF